MGRKSQSYGAAFESLILASIHYYKAYHMLAWGDKVGPPTKVLAKKGHRSWQGRRPTLHDLSIVVVGQGPPDFIAIHVSGYAGMIEAKSTANKNSLTIRDRMHQFVQLKEAREAAEGPGAFFGYLVEWRGSAEVRWHPIETLDMLFPPGVEFHREQGVLVPDIDGMPGVPDWLRVI